MMLLEQVIDKYISDCREIARKEMDEFRRLPSLRDAIRHAALCHFLPYRKRDGKFKRHPHQYRIPPEQLEAAERELQKAARLLDRIESFEALYEEIERLIGRIRGIGAVTIYDIARRIGAFLRLSPKLVYLHAGTAEGARHLGFTGKTLNPDKLPLAFLQLTPGEIEDCLCIYKDELTQRASRLRSGVCGATAPSRKTRRRSRIC